MTQSVEEVCQIVGSYADKHWNADDNRWEQAKEIIGDRRVTLGPQASQQWTDAPDHLAMVLARYRAAAALIGNAESVVEFGCGEGIGAGMLARGRQGYIGFDSDARAIAVAREVPGHADWFYAADILEPHCSDMSAVVALDVIEHIARDLEETFMRSVIATLASHGVCVIGTPNAAFEHLASPQSRAGHINLYIHDRLYALMRRHFRVVQSFGMQDTSLHLGHPEARHYLLMAGIGPR